MARFPTTHRRRNKKRWRVPASPCAWNKVSCGKRAIFLCFIDTGLRPVRMARTASVVPVVRSARHLPMHDRLLHNGQNLDDRAVVYAP